MGGVGSFTWKFTMPNDSTSPFSYSGEPSTITTAGGSASLTFSLADADSVSATGPFALSSLASDGDTGVDIYGSGHNRLCHRRF